MSDRQPLQLFGRDSALLIPIIIMIILVIGVTLAIGRELQRADDGPDIRPAICPQYCESIKPLSEYATGIEITKNGVTFLCKCK